MELPVAADTKAKAGYDFIEAQTAAALRPTGRRALEITLPMDGTVHHFSKLKDHAVLEIEIERVGDAKTAGRLLCLTGGLLLWLGVWWWTAKRKQKARTTSSALRTV